LNFRAGHPRTPSTEQSDDSTSVFVGVGHTIAAPRSPRVIRSIMSGWAKQVPSSSTWPRPNAFLDKVAPKKDSDGFRLGTSSGRRHQHRLRARPENRLEMVEYDAADDADAEGPGQSTASSS